MEINICLFGLGIIILIEVMMTSEKVDRVLKCFDDSDKDGDEDVR